MTGYFESHFERQIVDKIKKREKNHLKSPAREETTAKTRNENTRFQYFLSHKTCLKTVTKLDVSIIEI